MRIYRDPKAQDKAILARYKVVAAEDAGSFFCPYIPGRTAPSGWRYDPAVVHLDGREYGEFVFRMISNSPEAEQAIEWIIGNLRKEQYQFFHPNEANNGNLTLVRFNSAETATLFKLFCK